MFLFFCKTLAKYILLLIVLTLLVSCAHQNTGAAKKIWLQANLASYERKYTKALKLLQAATKEDPEFASAWLSKGMVYKRLKNEELAKKCYEIALQLFKEKYEDQPGNTDYINGYAEALSLLGYKEKAIKILDIAIKKFPNENTLSSFKEMLKRPNPMGVNQ